MRLCHRCRDSFRATHLKCVAFLFTFIIAHLELLAETLRETQGELPTPRQIVIALAFALARASQCKSGMIYGVACRPPDMEEQYAK